MEYQEEIEKLLQSKDGKNILLAIQLLQSTGLDLKTALRYLHEYFVASGAIRYTIPFGEIELYAGLKGYPRPDYHEFGFGSFYVFMELRSKDVLHYKKEKLIDEETMIDEPEFFPERETYERYLFDYYEAAIPILIKVLQL